MKGEFDQQLLAMLGPKTEEDMKPVEKPKKQKAPKVRCAWSCVCFSARLRPADGVLVFSCPWLCMLCAPAFVECTGEGLSGDLGSSVYARKRGVA